MALFAIALLAIIPAMQQAGRNMIYAQEAYTGRLQAQSLVLVVRDAIANSENPETRATQHAAGNFEFSFWADGIWFHSKGDEMTDYPEVTLVLNSFSAVIESQASIIVTVVWSEDNKMAGRALTVMY